MYSLFINLFDNKVFNDFRKKKTEKEIIFFSLYPLFPMDFFL